MARLAGIDGVWAAIFAVTFLLLAAQIFGRHPARRRWRPGTSVQLVPLPTSDATEQLRAVMAGRFAAKRVLSRTEAKVLRATETAIAEARLPWRVLAQVALGEVLSSPDEAAFRAINAKRVDLLIVAADHLPLAAIEYQGEGHWQGTAPARDAIKKEALRRAGIAYIEITPRDGIDDVRREIMRLSGAAIITAQAG